ncbi:MAG: cation-translocating P-type ATPase [Oscillospiraceae bacterium]|jgi:Ca2+-transporting ATPase|nr:cation-translocating P-type ATPase [Oscillospiraceae bacterium]
MLEHLSDAASVLSELGTSPDGLTEDNAAARLEENGTNTLTEEPRRSPVLRIWDQVKDPMVLILAAAGIISGTFGEFADMGIIFIVIILNVALGIAQENKAEASIEALKKMSAATSKVRRGGKVLVIPSAELVVGDIVLLEAGDSVPADIRLTECASLKIEEAALTGESVPVEKHSAAMSAPDGGDVPLGDRRNMAYMGTAIVYGRGAGVVARTGMSTEMGKIADALSASDSERTPLQKRLDNLSKILSAAVLGICVIIFAINLLRFGTGEIFDSFLTAISLAVAAIPEGLVVVVTVLLSIGVKRMSERSAIIRRLTAVETLGCAEIICSDKTGTLTQNKMTVVEWYGDELPLKKAMWLCNDAKLSESGNIGDPTEIALREFGRQPLAREIPPEGEMFDYERVAEAPFDSIRKMMSTLHAEKGRVVQYTKGAPDEILARCVAISRGGKIERLTDELRAEVLSENKRLADKALRVLGAAVRVYDEVPASTAPEELETQMVFAGLAGMIDPIRPEVKAAIEECNSAGIRAVMITGDHRDTAIAIAKELGMIEDESAALSGSDLSRIPDEEFDVTRYSVYARVQPEHKVRIVNAWRSLGKITAMTGDGVNDAPSLKAADIGVGMGITGTDVTKNVADMVLADDNFATIVSAVAEGRRIYENIRKAVQFLLSSNLAEVVSIFIATLSGFVLFRPIHILWINLVTDTFPAMALGVEPAEGDAMRSPPRPANASVFAERLALDVIWQGVVIGLLTLGSYLLGWILAGKPPLSESNIKAETMAFLTLAMCEVFHSLNMRSRARSILALGTQNVLLWGAMLLSTAMTFAVIYVPWLNGVFSLQALPLPQMFIAVGLAFMIIPITEIKKFAAARISRG